MRGLSRQRGCGQCPHLRMLYWRGPRAVSTVTSGHMGSEHQCQNREMPSSLGQTSRHGLTSGWGVLQLVRRL